MNDRKLRRAAWRVRTAVEIWAREDRMFHPRILRGACAIASSSLWHELRRLGADPLLVRGTYWDGELEYEHAWLLQDGRHLDITATQFGDYPDVMLRRQGEMFRVGQEGRPCDLFRRWPSWQRPSRGKVACILGIAAGI